MNVVLIIFDTLRQDHLGAYGNKWIQTPHLDAFANESVRFTNAYPESLPTLPFRRAIHTGKRTYPFRGHKKQKGDFNGSPGWGPIPEEQDTVAELLQEAGFRCALITDVYHQFKPSKNFHRGFDEWQWIRGQEGDRFRSGPAVDDDFIRSHMPESLKNDSGLEQFLRNYLRNNSERKHESDYYPAQLFSEASRWIWDNLDADNFFLTVDCFDPHEPFDPPDYLRRLYDPDDDGVANVIQSPYRLWKGVLTERELRRLQANYAGEVTLVDRWFGQLMDSLRLTGRLSNTLVVVTSDHGHNLGYDPGDRGLVSKQGHPMTKAVCKLATMIRHPGGEGAGSVCEALLYNHDITATFSTFAGGVSVGGMDGQNVWPWALDSKTSGRDYVTVAWGPLVTVITDTWWYNDNVWNEAPLLYRLADDPDLQDNLAGDNPKVCSELLALAIDDAGGQIPPEFKEYQNKPGCTPMIVE